MKKNIILLIIFTAFGVVNAYSQTPATPVPENKVADFKILTPEEAQKVEIEKQKKADEEQRLSKIREAQAQKDAERAAKKAKHKGRGGRVFLTIFGVAILGVVAYALALGSMY